jgi:aminoglycoside 6'-N-acetyltransferase I
VTPHPAEPSVSHASSIDREAAKRPARRTVHAAYTALGWVVLFFAFHIYWYLGGSLASPGELPPLTPGAHPAAAGSMHARVQLVAWIVEVPVDSAWPIGAWVCLAIARGWARGRLVRVTRSLVWVGCVVLLLRGAGGIVDDVTRASGLLPNGITGLSTEATTGHVRLRWADWTIDTYFLAGGLIFWLLATLYQTKRGVTGDGSGVGGRDAGPREHLADRRPGVQAVAHPVQTVLIRGATADDLDSINEVRAASGEAPWTGEMLVTREERVVLVAITAGAVVGIAKTSFHRESDDGAPAGHYLGGVIVAPAARRAGVGSALTRARMEWIWDRASRAFFFANERNAASIVMHEAFGFSPVGRFSSIHGVTADGEGTELILFEASR